MREREEVEGPRISLTLLIKAMGKIVDFLEYVNILHGYGHSKGHCSILLTELTDTASASLRAFSTIIRSPRAVAAILTCDLIHNYNSDKKSVEGWMVSQGRDEEILL